MILFFIGSSKGNPRVAREKGVIVFLE